MQGKGKGEKGEVARVGEKRVTERTQKTQGKGNNKENKGKEEGASHAKLGIHTQGFGTKVGDTRKRMKGNLGYRIFSSL